MQEAENHLNETIIEDTPEQNQENKEQAKNTAEQPKVDEIYQKNNQSDYADFLGKTIYETRINASGKEEVEFEDLPKHKKLYRKPNSEYKNENILIIQPMPEGKEKVVMTNGDEFIREYKPKENEQDERILTREQILKNEGLTESMCYGNEDEQKLSTGKITKSENLQGGSLLMKRIIKNEHGQVGILKTKAGEIRRARQEVEPGTMYIREFLAALLDKILDFHQVPNTAIMTLEGEINEQNIGSIQEWVHGTPFARFEGGRFFIEKARKIENLNEEERKLFLQFRVIEKFIKEKGVQNLKKEHRKKYQELRGIFLPEKQRRLFQTMKEEFTKKALSDLLMLNADMGQHPHNMNINLKELKIEAINNGNILCHPFYIQHSYRSFVTEQMRGTEISEDILQKLQNVLEKITNGSLEKELSPFLQKIGIRFDYISFLKLTIKKLLKEKKIISIKDLQNDQKFWDEDNEFFIPPPQ